VVLSDSEDEENRKSNEINNLFVNDNYVPYDEVIDNEKVKDRTLNNNMTELPIET